MHCNEGGNGTCWGDAWESLHLRLGAASLPAAPLQCSIASCSSASVQVLDWTAMLEFCAEHGVPVNDTWVIWGADAAAAATATLQQLSLSAPTTTAAIAALDDLLSTFPDSHVRIRGTYPHAEWQGSRLEGFVVAQGEAVAEAAVSRFRGIAAAVNGLQMSLAACASGTLLWPLCLQMRGRYGCVRVSLSW